MNETPLLLVIFREGVGLLKLNIKIGAQVMLTSNVNVVDSLSNGALGTVVDFEKSRYP